MLFHRCVLLSLAVWLIVTGCQTKSDPGGEGSSGTNEPARLSLDVLPPKPKISTASPQGFAVAQVSPPSETTAEVTYHLEPATAPFRIEQDGRVVVSGVVQPGATYALVASGTGSDGSRFEASFVVETHAAPPLIVTASASPNASQVFEVDGQAEVVMLMSVPAEETRPLVYALHPAAGPFAIDAETGAMSIVGEVEAGVAYDLVVVVTAEDGTSAVYPMTVQVGLAGGEDDGNGDAGGDDGAGDDDSSGGDDGAGGDDDAGGDDSSGEDDGGDSGSSGDAGDDGAGEDGSSGGDDGAGGDDSSGGNSDDSAGGADDDASGDDSSGGDDSAGSDDGVGGDGSSGGDGGDSTGGGDGVSEDDSSEEEDDKSDIPANTGTVPIKVSPVEVSVAEDLFQGMILATVSVSASGSYAYSVVGVSASKGGVAVAAGSGLFSLLPTGPVILSDALDYESADRYLITLQAEDKATGELGTTAFVVEVSDVEEAATGDEEAVSVWLSSSSVSLVEHSLAGSLLATVSAGYPDAQGFAYAITDVTASKGTSSVQADATLFTVLDGGPVILTKNGLDFEYADRMLITLRATAVPGGQSGTVTLELLITDEDEVNLQVVASPQEVTLAEDADFFTALSTISGSSNSGGTLRYQISAVRSTKNGVTVSGTAELFEVDQEGGLVLKGVWLEDRLLDYEEADRHEIDVVVTEIEKQVHQSVTVVLSVTNVPDLGLDIPSAVSVTLLEGASEGALIADLGPASYVGQTVEYTLGAVVSTLAGAPYEGAPLDGLFVFDAALGTLTLGSVPLDAGVADLHTTEVRASYQPDGSEVTLAIALTVTTDPEDVVGTTPAGGDEITISPSSKVSVWEGEAAGVVLYTLGETGDAYTYSIDAIEARKYGGLVSLDAGWLALSGGNQIVTGTVPLDYQSVDRLYLTVKATHQEHDHAQYVYLRLAVGDVRIDVSPSSKASVGEGESAGVVLYTLETGDAYTHSIDAIEARKNGGVVSLDAGWLVLSGGNQIVTGAVLLDYESVDWLYLTVKATHQAGGPTEYAYLQLAVENLSLSSLSPSYVELHESASVGTELAKLTVPEDDRFTPDMLEYDLAVATEKYSAPVFLLDGGWFEVDEAGSISLKKALPRYAQADKIMITIMVSLDALSEEETLLLTLSVYNTQDGSAEHPFQIYTHGELDSVRYGFRNRSLSASLSRAQSLSSHYVLVNSLDISGHSPIGSCFGTECDDADDPFVGVLDGNGHKLFHFNPEDRGGALGFVGFLGEEGVLRNIHLVGGEVTATSGYDSYYVGGLAGYSRGSIEGSSFQGTVTARTRADGSSAGGLVGLNDNGSIEGSVARADVSLSTLYPDATLDVSNPAFAGGLVGNNLGGTIRASQASGDVEGPGSNLQFTCHGAVGGLVGVNRSEVRFNGQANVLSPAVIEGSSASGTVRGEHPFGSRIGGLVGMNDRGTIRQSHAAGEVHGRYHALGGLVGENYRGLIDASYAVGAVVGDGIAGYWVTRTLPDYPWTDGSACGVTGGETYNSWVSRPAAGIGGLVGVNSSHDDLGGKCAYLAQYAPQVPVVTDSFATGEVSRLSATESHIQAVGGLIGGNYGGEVRQSYATGNILGGFPKEKFIDCTADEGEVEIWPFGVGYGGLVGESHGGTYRDVYATGSVACDGNHHCDQLGGFIGASASDDIDRAFWDSDSVTLLSFTSSTFSPTSAVVDFILNSGLGGCLRETKTKKPGTASPGCPDVTSGTKTGPDYSKMTSDAILSVSCDTSVFRLENDDGSLQSCPEAGTVFPWDFGELTDLPSLRAVEALSLEEQRSFSSDEAFAHAGVCLPGGSLLAPCPLEEGVSVVALSGDAADDPQERAWYFLLQVEQDLVEVLIESEGAADTRATLYADSDLQSEVISDDNDGAADNFYISVPLEPGTYYLRVQRVAADDGKPFTVRAWDLVVQ